MPARFNLRRLIDLGLIEWQEGDGGTPPIELVDITQASFEPCSDDQSVKSTQ